MGNRVGIEGLVKYAGYFGIGEKTFIFPDAFKQGFLRMKGE